MKKIFLIIAAVGLCSGLIATGSMAADVAQDTTSGAVTIDTSGVPGTPTFKAFQPSTNVIMDGATGATEFAIGAYHTQVLSKASGKAFGMASDGSAMYYLDIEGEETGPAVTATNSTAFNGTYQVM